MPTSRRLILSPLLAVVALAGVLGVATSSAAAGPGPETRVRANATAMVDAVGQRSGETAGGVGCLRPAQPAIASGSCVATEAAGDGFPAIKPGAAGGETAGKAFPGSVRQAALEENPGTCVYCHMETDAPQVDHAIPRVQGGNATLENAQTTCGWCNASKGGRTFPVNPPPGYEGAWPPPWWDIFGS